MAEPDYSLPLTLRKPREGVRIQLYLAAPYEQWTFARLRGEVWELESSHLPYVIDVADGIATHWMDEPCEPRELTESDRERIRGAIEELDVIIDAVHVGPRAIKAPAKRLK